MLLQKIIYLAYVRLPSLIGKEQTEKNYQATQKNDY